jgi:hypothetical protein
MHTAHKIACNNKKKLELNWDLRGQARDQPPAPRHNIHLHY